MLDLSVVIPARNEEAFIRTALESVAAQTWPADRLEVVVVDNGSTDATARVVHTVAKQLRATGGPEVRLISEPAPGLARAKNRGASAARGRCLVFLDADSTMAPDLATRIMTRLERGQPTGSIAIFADSPDLLDRGFFALMEFGKRAFGVRAQMFYCQRDLFLRAGRFNESLHLAEDSEFLGRIKQLGLPVIHLTESSIGTSPRRLHRHPFRLGLAITFWRWVLAHAGIGRQWHY